MLIRSSVLTVTLMLTILFPVHAREATQVSMAAAGKGINSRKRSAEAAVDSIAQSALQKYSIPGLTVAVIDKNELILAKGYGFADLQQRVPARGETIYQLGSISKQFTAAAVMRLVESGKLDLDDSIIKHLPEFPTQGHRVRIRDLLQHTSGIKEFFTIAGFEELESGSPDRYSRNDLMNLIKDAPFQFVPGERWAYSNSNYTLLGLIIESASGISYDRYLATTLFEPLSLNSFHSCGQKTLNSGFAKGYVKQERVRPAPPVNPNTAVGDGGLCSSAIDLAIWMRNLTQGRVVSEASFKEMIAPAPVRQGYVPEYGFGLSLLSLDGHRKVAHNGEITGFAGTVAFYPDHDLIIAVLANRSQIWPETIEKKIARKLLGIAPPLVRNLPLSQAQLQRYIGHFDFGVFPLRVFQQQGRLKYDMGMGRPPYLLLYQGNDTFVAQSEPDAIRLTFKGAAADKLLIEMAAMRWYAERVK